ncbi:MAG: HGxxPAAW family protein [Nocardioidaceae bacterium]
MSAQHGSTPAAWAAVLIVLIGFTVGSIGVILGPNWVLFWIGCALLPVALVVGKVMQAAGLGTDRRRIHEPHQ